MAVRATAGHRVIVSMIVTGAAGSSSAHSPGTVSAMCGAMRYRAMLFDLDGTLVDTNRAHVDAWMKTLAAYGHPVPEERIWEEVGKGGDQLVPSVLPDASERETKMLKDGEKKAFLQTAARSHFKTFPGAEELLDELRARGVTLALATSSGKDVIGAIFTSADRDLRPCFHVMVDGDDVESSKPAPDIVQEAVKRTGFAAKECAMIGDTPYDASAALKAGVAAMGVLTGPASEAVLREAGATRVFRDLVEMHAALERGEL
jgi:HAD superfamily hydrolase (TIGR01509 family)